MATVDRRILDAELIGATADGAARRCPCPRCFDCHGDPWRRCEPRALYLAALDALRDLYPDLAARVRTH